MRFPDLLLIYFYPRPPWGGRPSSSSFQSSHVQFLSTPSAGRATLRVTSSYIPLCYFNPRPPRGGRHTLFRLSDRQAQFLSTPSAGRATVYPCCLCGHHAYFYPRPPWGGRQPIYLAGIYDNIFLSTPSVGRVTRQQQAGSHEPSISIHALREEGDDSRLTGRQIRTDISIHALRGEGDAHEGCGGIVAELFLSTPSVGRATTGETVTIEASEFLSTPSVGRATILDEAIKKAIVISIHALRGEGDKGKGESVLVLTISIHALRGEGDGAAAGRRCTTAHFYPRPPRGGRPAPKRKLHLQNQFLSTPSVGRATCAGKRNGGGGQDFYPRPPWGGRPTHAVDQLANIEFLSTPSAGRATNGPPP